MSYSVKEVFDTIQGEGRHAGSRAVFVRFAGCNLWSGREQDRDKGAGSCSRWCDTDFFKGDRIELDDLLGRMAALWDGSGRRCVLTGGEPLLQADHRLINALHAAGWRVAVETNGTVDTTPFVHAGVWVTVSPKRGSRLLASLASELKVVLPGETVGDGWTPDELDALAARFGTGLLWVQPQDGRDGSVAECVAQVMRDPRWRLSMQLHKIAGLP